MDLLPDPSLPAFPPPSLAWADVGDTLLALAACDLDDGGPPIPRLAAFRGDEALTISTLRPFAPDEALDAIVELLALFVPLGADRVALGIPGRLDEEARTDDRPDDAGTAHAGLFVGTVDARDGCARSTGAIHPLHRDPTGDWGWGPAAQDAGAEGAAMGPIGVILDARDELLRSPWELRPQLERVLHLGHGLALSPAAAEALDVLGPPLLSPN